MTGILTKDEMLLNMMRLAFRREGIELSPVESHQLATPFPGNLIVDPLAEDGAHDLSKISHQNTNTVFLVDEFASDALSVPGDAKQFSRSLSDLTDLIAYLKSLKLPETTVPSAEPEKEPAGDAPDEDQVVSLSGAHVLVADDSKPIRRFVTKLLESKNFEVTTFENGQELLDYLKEDRGDLILIDNQMPVLSGVETLIALKQNSKTSGIPVLFLSAIKDKDQVVKALELGADDYIEKPFNNNEFFARINVHLRIEMLKREITYQKEQSDKLLLNTLPRKIVTDLKEQGKTFPETFSDVTVYFSDIVSFTKKSAQVDPATLINELNDIFTMYDNIMEKHQCERIKTIGDAYLAVCGMPEANEKHTQNIANAALEILDYMNKRNEGSERQWEIRIGIHTGKVVGGIVGVKKYIYDIFGDAINTASRMESNSIPMHINVSQETRDKLKEEYVFEEREPVKVKGKGELKMFFLRGTKNSD